MDANVLLRLAEPSHAHHLAAVNAVRALLASGAALHVAPQCIYEYWVVATRPISERGLGFSTSQCQRRIASMEAAFTLLAEAPEVYINWKRLAVLYKVQGKPSHDTRLVALMQAHGLSALLTFNARDFRRYAPEGIQIIDPATIGAS